MTERRYLIVIEAAEGENDSAYAPDLPGCVATGATRDEVEREMHDAIAFHLEGLRDAGQPIPEPSELTTTYVDVAARSSVEAPRGCGRSGRRGRSRAGRRARRGPSSR